MTKKDYIKLAQAIKLETVNLCDIYRDDINRFYLPKEPLIDLLCDILQEDNPAFDRKKFIVACQ
jgi:hypothetical protein